MMSDTKVLAFVVLVPACSGISFSYYAEGSFCLIKVLCMSPGLYGSTFVLLPAAAFFGSYSSKKMHDMQMHSFDIATRGVSLISV